MTLIQVYPILEEVGGRGGGGEGAKSGKRVGGRQAKGQEGHWLQVKVIENK